MRKLAVLLATALTIAGIAGCGSGASQSATGSIHPNGWGKPIRGFASSAASTAPTATMLDTIDLKQLAGLRLFALAGYTSGHWPTYLPMRRDYPKVHVVSIAVSASFHADCLDVEPGDAVPAQVVGWINADRRAGFTRPCVYSSLFEYVNEVRPLIAAAHIARSSIFEWDADYTFVPHLDAGFDATQWTDHYVGRNLDASVVTLSFLTIARPPYVPPCPAGEVRTSGVCKLPPCPTGEVRIGGRCRVPNFNENFQGGFLRGFVVGFDRRHHRAIPAPTFAATNSGAFNLGFKDGFNAGWKA